MNIPNAVMEMELELVADWLEWVGNSQVVDEGIKLGSNVRAAKIRNLLNSHKNESNRNTRPNATTDGARTAEGDAVPNANGG